MLLHSLDTFTYNSFLAVSKIIIMCSLAIVLVRWLLWHPAICKRFKWRSEDFMSLGHFRNSSKGFYIWVTHIINPFPCFHVGLITIKLGTTGWSRQTDCIPSFERWVNHVSSYYKVKDIKFFEYFEKKASLVLVSHHPFFSSLLSLFFVQVVTND